MRFGHPVASRRVGEDHAAVADGGHDEAVRRRQLGPQRSADTPPQSAGRAQREVAARLRPGTSIQSQLIFIEDEPVRTGDLTDAAAEILRRNVRGIGRDACRRPWHARGGALCRPFPPLLEPRLCCVRRGLPKQSPALSAPRRRWPLSTDGSGTSAWDSAGTPGPRRCEQCARSATGALTLGIHGTSASMTRMRSASSMKGWGSNP